MQHFFPKEKFEMLEDYLLNEFKIFDNEKRLINNTITFAKYHGSAIKLYDEDRWP